MRHRSIRDAIGGGPRAVVAGGRAGWCAVLFGAAISLGCADIIGADFDVHAACDTCPVVLADQRDHPKSVAVSGGFVFWTEQRDVGSVMKVPLGGGAPVVISNAEPRAEQIVAAGGYVYWTDNVKNTGAVRRVKVGGGVPEDVATNLSFPLGLAVDDNRVYWTEVDSGNVMSLALDAIGMGQPGTVLVPSVESVSLLAVDKTYLYFTRLGDKGGISRVPVAGGMRTDVAAIPSANSIVLGLPGLACVTTYTGGSGHDKVQCAVTDQTDGEVNVATDRDGPGILTSDGTYVYWGEVGTGNILRGEPQGTPVVIASGQLGPNGIAFDGTFLYWANFAKSGSIVKMAPPM